MFLILKMKNEMKNWEEKKNEQYKLVNDYSIGMLDVWMLIVQSKDEL